MRPVWLGLGSNLGDRRAELEHAVALLEEAGVVLLRRTVMRETPPWGNTDQPPFLNAVIEVDPGLLGPRELLEITQAIESARGRQRATVWGPRTLDIDLLRFGDVRLDDPQLVLPHPQIEHRSFVLISLIELDPGWVLPSGETVATALQALEVHHFPPVSPGWQV